MLTTKTTTGVLVVPLPGIDRHGLPRDPRVDPGRLISEASALLSNAVRPLEPGGELQLVPPARPRLFQQDLHLLGQDEPRGVELEQPVEGLLLILLEA